MKFFSATTLFISILLISNAGLAKSCPADPGELQNQCETEQFQVEQAMQGLEVAKQYNYCRVPSPDKPNGVGLQCRTFTLYKDSSGQVTRDFFKFQFIATEVHRTLLFDTYYVKNSDGTYNSYHDEVADQILKIDNQKPDWRGVHISFDDGDFPFYETVFITPSGDPNVPPIQKTAKIVYGEFSVQLINDSDKPKDQQTVIIYGNVGPKQVPSKD